MREILFRGKRTDNGEWVEGAFCLKDSDSPFGDMVDSPSIIKYDPPFDGFWFRVAPETVGQYTGLTDKNGKKIFEGDILNCGDRIVRVGWNQYCGCWDSYFVSYIGKIQSNGINNADWKYRAESIGNIYDNPELLKEGE